jgi:hypothetical protein
MLAKPRPIPYVLKLIIRVQIMQLIGNEQV